MALASLLAWLQTPAASAQAVARVEVTAHVVNLAPSRLAIAMTKWLAGGKSGGRKESGLATIEVNRERGTASINYLRN